jgi:hypothetical protein
MLTTRQNMIRTIGGLFLIACCGGLGCSAVPAPAGAGGVEPGGGTPTGGGGDEPPAPSPTTPAAPPPPFGSRCTIGPTINDVSCTHETMTMAGRQVSWQTPLGTPPAGGWPVVMIYQGSLISPDGQTLLAPHGMWTVTASDAALDGLFANYVLQQLTTETMLLKSLLDGGYAIITPTADGVGFAWDTNLPPWLYDWVPAPDNGFLEQLFAAVGTGRFGPLSATRWYATGVSSGGYMTSRMAVSYQGMFKALAIASGSYATCGGGLPCTVPDLPADHPPTLFLHGGSDPLVPVAQMQAYRDKLVAMGCETKAIVDPDFKHGWLALAPEQVLAWFQFH